VVILITKTDCLNINLTSYRKSITVVSVSIIVLDTSVRFMLVVVSILMLVLSVCNVPNSLMNEISEVCQ
jgi:hypothetical protein